MYTPYGTELNEKERKTMRIKRNPVRVSLYIEKE